MDSVVRQADHRENGLRMCGEKDYEKTIHLFLE